MKKQKKNKPRKAIDVFQDWLKKYCKKGDLLYMSFSDTAFAVRKGGLDSTFAYKRVGSKNKKK